jgi:hypothetical protein
MIFWREVVSAATGNDAGTRSSTHGGGTVAAVGWNGGWNTVAPLTPFHVAVGPYRYLPGQLEANFAKFWIHYIFSKNCEKINIF